jgi:hypothetical protein
VRRTVGEASLSHMTGEELMHAPTPAASHARLQHAPAPAASDGRLQYARTPAARTARRHEAEAQIVG